MNVINLSRSAKSFLGILWISGLFWLGTALYAEAPSASPDAALTRNHLLVQLLDGPAEQPVGWKLLGVLVLIALATLITEDLTCVVTGLMIANGTLLWSQGLTACLLGILFGDFLLYLAGRRLGRPAIRKIPLRWMIDPVKLMETEDWFHRRGGLTILISRFVPGTRLPAYVAAGILGVPCLKFTAYFVLAALIWTPSLIWISTKLAGKALLGIQKYNQEAPWVVLALILTYVVVLKIFIPCLSWRGRRLLVGRWRRWTRPEYWPTSVLYFPVFFYLVFRALRAGRHPMDFSACNPFIPGAGMVEESKGQILDAVQDRTAVAAYAQLPREASLQEKCRRVESFLADRGCSFPVVIKPDIGQRGDRVVIAKSTEDVEKALRNAESDFLVQEYIPGEEFGVFYIRHPNESRGRIFAITRKTFPVVVGDGVKNLEELILRHPRAVCQAETHFRRLQNRLFEVPEAGESVQLTDLGNHCQGTCFEDGMSLLTPELEQRVEQISRSIPGFYFGRYDLIAPDVEAFQRGEGLKVIELNGVSSEATSMYDPRRGYVHMLRTLMYQWRTASAIGLELQRQGHPRMTLRELMRGYDTYLRRENRRRFLQARLKKSKS